MVFASTFWWVWLGHAIISNLIVASFLAIVATIIGWRLRRPALTHGLWVLVLIKLVTPPLFTIAIPAPSWMDFSQVVAVSQQSTIEMENLIGKNDQNDVSRSVLQGERVGPRAPLRMTNEGTSEIGKTTWGASIRYWLTNTIVFLFAAWFCVAIILMARSLLRSIRFARVLQHEGREHEAASQLGLQMAQASDIHLSPRVRMVSASLSPMLFGFSRWATIVIPFGLWDGLDIGQKRAMLAHELAHYKRGDHWVRGLELVVGSLFFWFPLVRIARTQIERMEEICCDLNAVDALDRDRRLYAESLLHVVDYISQRGGRMPGLASGMRPTITLEERLRSIMNEQATGRLSQRHRSILGALTLLVVLIHPLASAAPRALNAVPVGNVLERENAAGTIIEESSSPRVSHWNGPLPEPPKGWWNEPQSTSAIRTLSLKSGPMMRLRVNPGVSIDVVYEDKFSRRLVESAPTAMATLHHSDRLIIANNKGDIRIWDVESQESVSLIGHHEGPVTTICYHPKFGLLSGDSTGTLVQWEIQSGAIQNSISLDRGPIQSIRCSQSGDEIAIVLGDWKNKASSALVFIDSTSWRETSTMNAPADVTAVAVVCERDGVWNAIDWLGNVYRFPFQQKIGLIPKNDVSAIAFTQDAVIPDLLSVPLENPAVPYIQDLSNDD